MNEIILKYIGGKSLSKLYYNRVRYIFNKENNFTASVPLGIWNLVKQTNEFIPAPILKKSEMTMTTTIHTEPEETKPKEKSDNVCDICGFKAKSKTGLIAHSRKHIRKKEAK